MYVKHGGEIIAEADEMAECAHDYFQFIEWLAVWGGHAQRSGHSFFFVNQRLNKC